MAAVTTRVEPDPYADPGYFGPPARPPVTRATTWMLFPAHGGCGASTVAALLTLDGTGVALHAGPDQQIPADVIPVVVATSSAYGTASACELITQWPTSLPDPWLVTVADAPVRPSQTARFYLRAVRGRVAGTARVAYLPRLRTVVSITEILQDRSVLRASRSLLQQLAHHPAP